MLHPFNHLLLHVEVQRGTILNLQVPQNIPYQTNHLLKSTKEKRIFHTSISFKTSNQKVCVLTKLNLAHKYWPLIITPTTSCHHSLVRAGVMPLAPDKPSSISVNNIQCQFNNRLVASIVWIIIFCNNTQNVPKMICSRRN